MPVPTLTTRMLRDAIAEALWAAMSPTELERFCTAIGLSAPVPGVDQAYSSKRQYVIRRLAGMPIPQMVDVGRRVLDECDTTTHSAQALAETLARFGAGGVDGEMKNLIFAADGPKPQIILSDALNNDLLVVRNAEHCLVYDRPLGADGLTWSQLTGWWAEREQLAGWSDVEVSRSLYARLDRSMANDAERRVLRAYAQRYVRLGPDIPALLPQVYLHYDPYSRAQYAPGLPPLARYRMDFLLLMPNRARVVIEVDGVQHYADASGRADPREYARMVAEDRALRLRGYELYRFGGDELRDGGDGAPDLLLAGFFDALAGRHGRQ
jgi:hypothetical protein